MENNTNSTANIDSTAKPPVVVGVYASGWCDSAPRYNEWSVSIPFWGEVTIESRSFQVWNDGAGVVTRTTRPGWVKKEVTIPRKPQESKNLSTLCKEVGVPPGSWVRVEWFAGDYREGIVPDLLAEKGLYWYDECECEYLREAYVHDTPCWECERCLKLYP